MARRNPQPAPPPRVQSIMVTPGPRVTVPFGTIRVRYLWSGAPVSYRVVATQWRTPTRTSAPVEWANVAARVAPRGVLLAEDQAHVSQLLRGARDVATALSYQTAGAQRLADDFAEALRNRDLRRLRHLSGVADQLLHAPQQPPRARTPHEELQDAANLLHRSGREEDARVVIDLAGRVNHLPVRDQEAARQAAAAIRDAYRHLDRVPADLADLPGPDGTTPREDAASVVDASVGHLRRARTAATTSDTNALRALRRYSGQWADKPGPLDLDH
ncbi:hypothetical protein G9U51_14290 [Calidifontibacter sp. DB0510]|uniref:Uncharacterized protein n=1 Tax=Metallococcus carri TaxID=1656884 RepID=A0A967EB50_9MICO|nr:hypothetical protein [Metallococcus carri]NHN56940.1 hypothetical protein [Metallococcus carri]NOP37685.1 hypothetical protein [Calidifontibacter sp. DB2511S]